MSTLTWLHLSDLHLRPAQSYNANVVLAALLRDAAERVQAGLRPDWIAVTGDVAFSGQPDEYAMARPFFDELLRVCGLPRERLFVVPGNHDVDRRLITTGAKAIGAGLADRDSANEVLNTPDDRRLLLARFKGYAAFVNDYLPHLGFDDERYFYVRTINAGGKKVALLGLNSAWLCASDEEKGKLLIGERQARAALEQAQGADLKIALVHHPFDWLREFDQDDSFALLTGGCDFILHGHLHRTSAARLTTPDAEAMVLAGGACYETREFPNVLNWVQLDLAAGKGKVHLRRYSDRQGGFWTGDTLTYKNAGDGTYTFTPRGGAQADEGLQMARLESLIDKAKAHQLVLLIGSDLAPADTGLPSSVDLARGLADRLKRPRSDSLAEVARGPRSQNMPFRYYNYLKEALPAGRAPGRLHQAAAALPVALLVTAAYDDRLARALEAAGHPANLLIQDGDLDRLQPHERSLVKICGDLGQPHTLVVAGQEYENLLQDPNRRKLLDLAGRWLREKTVLLVGCNPAQDGDFENWLYAEVLRKLGAFGAGGYLAWPQPAAADVDRWGLRGVQVIDAEPASLLESLAPKLQDVKLLESQEIAALKGLLQVLRGAPTEAQVEARAAGAPASARLRSIRLSFNLGLANQELQAALQVGYDPDIDSFQGQPRPTGITLDQLDEWAAEAARLRRQWKLPQHTPVEQKGLAFFDALLPPGSDERRMYEHAALYLPRTFADDLSIVFDLADARLSLVPWEMLHDGQASWMAKIQGAGFLGLEYPVYRRLPTVSSPGQVAGRIQKALIVAADPTQNLGQLEGEIDWLAAALQNAQVAQVDVRRHTDPEVDDPEAIKRLLRDGGYHLLHFTGHGVFDADNPAASCLVLGRPGQPDVKLTANDLAQVARDSALTLVFLSACELGGAAAPDAARPWDEAGVVDALVRSGVPAAIGMQWKVGDQNARKLVETFYKALLSSRKPIEHALMAARQAVQDQPDWANPVLVKRHGVLG